MTIWTRFSARLRRAVAVAAELAGTRGCNEMACEHLLLAVSQDAESAGGFVIDQSGRPREDILKHLDEIAPRGNLLHQRAGRLSASCLGLITIAGAEADRLGHPQIGTEHVVLAITLSNDSINIGLSHPVAVMAVQKWFAEERARRRPQSSRLNRLPKSLRKAVMLPATAWKVLVGKSLGHPGFISNPYPLYRWLRQHHPVRRDPIAPVWVATRYADVVTILKDPRLNKDPFAAARLPAGVREQLGIRDDQVRTADVETVSMLFLDPPQHTRVRAVFSKAFTPRMINGLRSRIQQLTNDQLQKVLPAGRMDVIQAIAYPLPVIVIAELLGFPPQDYPAYKKWSDDLTAALGFNPTPEQLAIAAKSRRELQQYFDRVVETLQQQQGDNLLSALLAMEDDAGGISREELFINSVLLLAAGHETTTNLIGNGIWHLLQNPAQYQQLRDDPTLIESAVEEFLRFDSPVQWMSRVVREPIELGGIALKPGSILLGSLGAANRDPDQFTDPERLDLRRSDNKHLALGAGAHFCLGATLARIEAQIVIGTLVQRLPNLRLVKPKVRWKKGLIFRAIERLDVQFDL